MIFETEEQKRVREEMDAERGHIDRIRRDMANLDAKRDQKREKQEKEEKKIRNIEKRIDKEEWKQSVFSQVKSAYKNGSKFERFKRKIQGKAPNWKEIEKLDRKDLEYLLRVNRGDTFVQKQKEKERRRRERKEKHLEKLTEKQIVAKRFNKFANTLGLSNAEIESRRVNDIEIALEEGGHTR